MSESNINVTPGSGGPNIDLEIVDNNNARQVIVIGDPIDSIDVAPVDSVNGLAVDNKTLPPLASTSTHQTDGLQKTQVVGATGNVTVVSSTGGLSVDITGIGSSALGQEVSAASIPVVIASDQSTIQTSVNNQVQLQPTLLVVTAVGASGAAVTATLPAVVGQFHYITGLEITRYATVVNTASATPITVTTTNLPGSLAFTFDNGADTLGSVSIRNLPVIVASLKSSVVDTATTIVAPSATGVLWRITVYYYTGV